MRGWAQVVPPLNPDVRRSLENMLVTPLYAAIFGLVFVALSVRTLWLRRKLGVALGDGDKPVLMKATRAHANFAEYVPISLLLVFFLETRTDAALWVHVLCIALLIGRIIHAYGVSQLVEDYRFRMIGVALTIFVVVSSSVRLLVSYV